MPLPSKRKSQCLRLLATLFCRIVTEKIPDYAIGIDDISGIAQTAGSATGPGMSAITYAVVYDAASCCAVRPFHACHIPFLEKDLCLTLALVMTEPDVQIDLHR